FMIALLTRTSIGKQPKCPSVDEWIKKMCVIHTHEYYTAIKKNEILPFATTWMDFEGIMLSKLRQRKTNII
ncbi:LORF2 protein, partial [Crocuta crocuta]